MRVRAALLSLALSCAAQADPAANPALDRGRAIFSGAPDTGLQVRVGDRLRPARGISCAGCHGHDAQGGAEVQSGPAIDWPHLQRRGYTQPLFARALTQGIAPDGRTLGGAMPRFALGDQSDVPDLVDFLQRVSAEQRIGVTDHQIVLQRPPLQEVSSPFWKAFEDTLGVLAPHGVFGRRIRLSGDTGLAMIGALAPRDLGSQPSLFPLHPLLGDEDPSRIRGAFASVADQVRTASLHHPDLVVIAPAGMLHRLRDVLKDTKTAFSDDVADLSPDRHAMVLGGSLIKQMPPARDFTTTVDDLAQMPPVSDRCVLVTDPRPNARQGQVMASYGQIAAAVMVEALRRCGDDCTRAALIRGFDRIALPHAASWSSLDYGAHPLTGTAKVTVRRFCHRPDDR